MKNKTILTILILSMIALIFSGCIGGSVTPPIPNNSDDSNDTEIPEPTEAIFQFGKLVLGGISCHLVWKDNSDNEEGFLIERRLYPSSLLLLDPDVHHADFRLVIEVGPDVQTYTDVVPLAAIPEYRVAAIATDGHLSEWTTFLWGEVTCPEEEVTLTPEEIELIRKWGFGGDYVVRWPNGYVDVYDATNYSQMQKVINEWNSAIGGPVILRLSSNPNSLVRIIFNPDMSYCGREDVQWGDDYVFSEVIIEISPDEYTCETYNINTKYCLYLHMFNAVVGFNYWAEIDPCPFEDWSNFSTIPEIIKTMVHALHKVPPGYYLGSSNPKMGYSPTIIENMQLGIDSGCVSNCKK